MATQEQVDALTAAVTDLTATTAEAVASITASKNEPTIDVEGITTAITTASDTLKTALAPTEPTPPAEDQTPVE